MCSAHHILCVYVYVFVSWESELFPKTSGVSFCWAGYSWLNYRSTHRLSVVYRNGNGHKFQRNTYLRILLIVPPAGRKSFAVFINEGSQNERCFAGASQDQTALPY